MVGSVVERALGLGIGVFGSDAVIEGTAVLDTRPDGPTSIGANGLLARSVPSLGARSNVTMRTSLIDGYEQVGVFSVGSDVTLDAVRVQGARPDEHHGEARGVAVQSDPDGGDPGTARVLVSAIDGSVGMGLSAVSGLVEVADTLIIGAQPLLPDGLFGDGLFLEGAGDFSVTRCRIESSTRAAVAVYGATLRIAGTTMQCNPIDLTGSDAPEAAFEFVDLGGNVCGCGADAEECTVRAAELTPPAPLEPGGP